MDLVIKAEQTTLVKNLIFGEKMGEKWEEYYTRNQLQLLQKIEIENLQIFIDVCNQLELEYFLYGGTLLGAEKYKGMIPWDDDIDVAMPRDSYIKFIEKAEAVLPKCCYLQSPYNCPKTPFPYTKLRRRGTVYLEKEFKDLGLETGIYIDIYPVDRIPDNDKLYHKQFKKVHRWILMYVLRQARLYKKPDLHRFGFLRRSVKFVLHNILRLFPQSFYIKKLDHCMKKYNGITTKRYAAMNSPNINNIYLNLYPFQKGTFEGMDVVLPGDHITHLKMRYGDMDKVLPEEKRYGHIPYRLDFGEYEKME